MPSSVTRTAAGCAVGSVTDRCRVLGSTKEGETAGFGFNSNQRNDDAASIIDKRNGFPAAETTLAGVSGYRMAPPSGNGSPRNEKAAPCLPTAVGSANPTHDAQPASI